MEKHFGIAVKGLIMREGRALIVKRSDYSVVSPGCWECPGGKVEFGESLQEAMARETREETGLEVSVEKLLNASVFMPNEHTQLAVLTYLCRPAEGETVLSDEHSDFRWADLSLFRELVIPTIVRELEEAGALAAAGLRDG